MRISDWSSDVCSSDLLGDGGDVLLVLLDQVVAHPEAVLRVDRALLGHQVADVAVRRQDGEVLAQVLVDRLGLGRRFDRSEEHTSELQSLMRISYAVFCLKKKNN